MAEVIAGEEIAEGQSPTQAEKVRRVVADVYTFVRSQEINRTIGSFTFDHYIDEAKRRIKGTGRAIRNAAGESFDQRPTKLEFLDSLEAEFRASFKTIEELAKVAKVVNDEEVAAAAATAAEN